MSLGKTTLADGHVPGAKLRWPTAMSLAVVFWGLGLGLLKGRLLLRTNSPSKREGEMAQNCRGCWQGIGGPSKELATCWLLLHISHRKKCVIAKMYL